MALCTIVPIDDRFDLTKRRYIQHFLNPSLKSIVVIRDELCELPTLAKTRECQSYRIAVEPVPYLRRIGKLSGLPILIRKGLRSWQLLRARINRDAVP